MAIWLDQETGEFSSDGNFTSTVFEEAGMNTYEFEVPVRIMIEAENESDAYTQVELWLGQNVFEYGQIVEVS